MKRAVLIILGVFLLVMAVPMLVGGSILAAWASGDDPSIAGRIGRVDSSGYAVVSDRVDVDWEWPGGDRWDITIGVESDSTDVAVFVGYGPTDAVDAYLAGSPYTLATSIGDGEPRSSGDIEIPGTEAPEQPGDQAFWAEQASGVGRQTIDIAPDQGDYRFVAMNADASAGVDLAVYGSMRVPFLFPIGVGIAVFGGLLGALGIVLLVLGIRAKPSPQPVPAPYPGYGAAGQAGMPSPTGQYPYQGATPYPYAQPPGTQPVPQPAPAAGTQPVPAATEQMPPTREVPPATQPAPPPPEAPPAPGDEVPPDGPQPTPPRS